IGRLQGTGRATQPARRTHSAIHADRRTNARVPLHTHEVIMSTAVAPYKERDVIEHPAVPVSTALEVVGQNETASTAAAVQAKTQVEARYMMAIRQPRSLMQFRAKLLDACKRPRFAESAR